MKFEVNKDEVVLMLESLLETRDSLDPVFHKANCLLYIINTLPFGVGDKVILEEDDIELFIENC